eukprot:143149_1
MHTIKPCNIEITAFLELLEPLTFIWSLMIFSVTCIWCIAYNIEVILYKRDLRILGTKGKALITQKGVAYTEDNDRTPHSYSFNIIFVVKKIGSLSEHYYLFGSNQNVQAQFFNRCNVNDTVYVKYLETNPSYHSLMVLNTLNYSGHNELLILVSVCILIFHLEHFNPEYNCFNLNSLQLLIVAVILFAILKYLFHKFMIWWTNGVWLINGKIIDAKEYNLISRLIDKNDVTIYSVKTKHIPIQAPLNQNTTIQTSIAPTIMNVLKQIDLPNKININELILFMENNEYDSESALYDISIHNQSNILNFISSKCNDYIYEKLCGARAEFESSNCFETRTIFEDCLFTKWISIFTSKYHNNSPFDPKLFEEMVDIYKKETFKIIKLKYENYAKIVHNKTYDDILKNFIGWLITYPCTEKRCLGKSKLICYCNDNHSEFQLNAYDLILNIIKYKTNNNNSFLYKLKDTDDKVNVKSIANLLNVTEDSHNANLCMCSNNYKHHIVKWLKSDLYKYRSILSILNHDFAVHRFRTVLQNHIFPFIKETLCIQTEHSYEFEGIIVAYLKLNYKKMKTLSRESVVSDLYRYISKEYDNRTLDFPLGFLVDCLYRFDLKKAVFMDLLSIDDMVYLLKTYCFIKVSEEYVNLNEGNPLRIYQKQIIMYFKHNKIDGNKFELLEQGIFEKDVINYIDKNHLKLKGALKKLYNYMLTSPLNRIFLKNK